MQKINMDIIYNFMCDFKKKEIDPQEQARIIEFYMKENNLSARGLARELGVSKSTILAKIKWGKISRNKVAELKSQGYSRKEIFRMLNDKKTDINAVRIDKAIQDLNAEIRALIHNPAYTENTVALIQDLQNNLNRLLMRIERGR